MARRKVESVVLRINGHPTDIAVIEYTTPAAFRNSIHQRDIFAMRSSNLSLSSIDTVVATLLQIANIWNLPHSKVEVYTGVIKDTISYCVFRKEVKYNDQDHA